MEIDGPKRSPRATTEPPGLLNPLLPPLASSATKAITLMAISTLVTSVPPRAAARLRTFVRCLAHSGQRMPTGVGVMQSGQIGRPQFEHETPVSRLGCR